MSKNLPVLAWHFVGAALRDGSPIPADGVTLKFSGRLELCASGFHASRRLIDALQYAPGGTLCRVECGGTIEEGGDKLVCRQRTILWRVDSTDFLRLFARQCALDVLHLWNAPDVVRQYLETGNEKLRAAAWAAAWDAAWAAAGDTARDAAWDAARAAARAAARDAARAAAWAAAWDAAWAAAWAAAGDAAWDAARAAQNERLEKLAYAAHEASK